MKITTIAVLAFLQKAKRRSIKKWILYWMCIKRWQD